MDYAEVREAFFQLRDTAAPEPGTSVWQSPARRLRDAIEPIATICYWSEPAYDAYATLGLDFLQGYVWSRGCVLGEPDGGVVAADRRARLVPARPVQARVRLSGAAR